jgi:hypothetical protein
MDILYVRANYNFIKGGFYENQNEFFFNVHADGDVRIGLVGMRYDLETGH